MEKIFLNAAEVAKTLGISEAHAYKIIRKLNEELNEKGMITISGKISKKYFAERVYGYEESAVKE